MKRFFLVLALLALSPQVLLAANAATWVHIDGYGRVYGRAHGTGDHVPSLCWAGPGNGRCATLSIDDNGNVAHSSTTAIKHEDEVHTVTFNQAIDSQGRSSMNMSTVPVRITDAGAGTVGLAQAGSGVPVTYARTSDENPLAPQPLLPSASPVAPVGHMAPTREGRKN
jgi:hypothetical protein